MFNEQLGLTNVTQGKGEPGVRAKGHAAELAKLGSARVKNTAFTVEDALDRIGTLYLKSMQVYDKRVLTDEGGQKFTAAQFTSDAEVRVDAHSSSPIFVEDQRSLADELLQARAIDRHEYIEMKNPPSKQTLQGKLKKIEAAEKAAHDQEMKAEAQRGGMRAVK